MALHFDILTIFPGMFAGVLGESIIARALSAGLATVEFTNIRDFATDRHRSVDDRPYGGGPGMVFKPEPVFAAVESVLQRNRAAAELTRKIILTPQGLPLRQGLLREFSRCEWIVLLCGHYEGFDQRIIEGLRFDEVSVGDYVLSGGEIPAMAILDGVVRLVPGSLGHPGSASAESFERGLLDHPHYTRPPEFRGMQVPEVLVSGNHRQIEKWRRVEAYRKTAHKRKDLLGLEGGSAVAGAGELRRATPDAETSRNGPSTGAKPEGERLEGGEHEGTQSLAAGNRS